MDRLAHCPTLTQPFLITRKILMVTIFPGSHQRQWLTGPIEENAGIIFGPPCAPGRSFAGREWLPKQGRLLMARPEMKIRVKSCLEMETTGPREVTILFNISANTSHASRHIGIRLKPAAARGDVLNTRYSNNRSSILRKTQTQASRLHRPILPMPPLPQGEVRRPCLPRNCRRVRRTGGIAAFD